MAFRQANFARLTRFNSANSCDFLEMIEKAWDKRIIDENSEPKNQSIAPSVAYCMKQNWFRLRGVQPDTMSKADRTLDFTAQLGTACHENLQSLLSDRLGEDWLDIEKYLDSIKPKFTYTVEKHGLEWRVAIENPSIRFACDGIVRWKGKIYLLEIKTSEHSSFEDLIGPKEIHIAQVKSYASLFGIKDILMVYQDRQYGSLKCFEVHVSEVDMQITWDTFNYIIDMADKNLPPAGLPSGDSRCSSSMCPYYKKCKEW